LVAAASKEAFLFRWRLRIASIRCDGRLCGIADGQSIRFGSDEFHGLDHPLEGGPAPPHGAAGTAAQQAHDNLSRGPVANFAAHHMMCII
jgi:hypothetical protein